LFFSAFFLFEREKEEEEENTKLAGGSGEARGATASEATELSVASAPVGTRILTRAIVGVFNSEAEKITRRK